MKIYLCCPYSHPDENIRQSRFKAANEATCNLMREGHIVFSPISHSHPIAVQCNLPKGWDFWHEFDKAFIEWADTIYVLKIQGWKESVGVQAEIKIAQSLSKPIFFMR